MGRLWLTVAGLVAVLALVAGVSAASGNEPPMADAGLDQTVDNGTTVYLDAGGSVDPDGTIVDVQWTITGPDGTPVTPAAETSTRTRFTPTRTGNYTANVSLTDDDGATRSDELYVTVEERAGPNVTLTGPSQTFVGQPTAFTVRTTAGDVDLRELYWLENGTTERTMDLTGNESAVTLNRSFSEAKSYELDATVLDTQGYSRTSSLTVDVVAGGGGGGTGYDHCSGGGSPYFVDGEFIGCNDGGADMVYEDHVLEANDRDGIWLYDDGDELVEMASQEEREQLQGGSNEPLTRDEVDQNYDSDIESDQQSESQQNIPRRYRDGGSSGDNNSDDDLTDPSGNTGSSVAPSPPIDTVAPSPSPSPSF